MFLGFMLMFSMFMIISLLSMLMFVALCFSSRLYVLLVRNMLITERESFVSIAALQSICRRSGRARLFPRETS
ncbi:hypothetical protein CUU66_01705 [Peribacillus deserti]|uniref:Uncharacterized protein n=1 Tax=Peribacillus deserti TaxID=673318 RepID=A0A2N5MB70_9BACI|nr:hypothetical protein CUU66_01705 [Peribacillus deserti]